MLINGHVAKFDTFSDDPSEPWFEAKAIRNALGCSTITQSLERLHQDDKMSFGDLIKPKRPLVGGVVLNTTPLGYNEAKAIRTTESGLYTGQHADTRGLVLRDVPALLEAYLPPRSAGTSTRSRTEPS